MDETLLRMMLGGDPDAAADGARTNGSASNDRGSARGTRRGAVGQTGAENAAFKLPTLHGVPLAMVYSPEQEFGDLYDPEEGLASGTIFRDLDFPFYPAACGSSCAVRR